MIGFQLVCYGGGCWWFSVYSGSVGAAVLACVVPYLIPDGIKLWLAYGLSKRLRKHIT
jgi:biotin transport system substrate-specific component